MYAILEIAGKQFKVEENKYVNTPKLKTNKNENVTFDKVLFVQNENGQIEVGAPTVPGMKVTGKIVDHLKSKKVIVFKKKRRKGYKVKNGHKQDFSKVLIEKITKE